MITLSKIAKEAHVSVSTASKAFSGSAEVNEDTRQIIYDVAKRYGCFKKFFNAKYSKYVIAIICPEFGSIHYARYLSFLRKYLEKENCEVCVAETNFSAEKEKELLDYYYKYADVDAIIVMQPQSIIHGYHEIPVLIIGRNDDRNDCACVFDGIDIALAEGIDYLTAKGVSSIGFIGESLTTGKLKYFQKILTERGLSWDNDHIQIVQQRFEAGGYEATENILRAESLPRAIVCAYDNMAIGAIRCLTDHGLKVPDDMAILGMDDIPQAPYLVPSLASIAPQIEVLCSLAAKTIINQINGKEISLQQVVPAKLQLRTSFEIS